MTKTRFKDQFFRFRMLYSGDETCNVGKDEAFPVSPDYGPRGNQYIKANNIRPWKWRRTVARTFQISDEDLSLGTQNLVSFKSYLGPLQKVSPRSGRRFHG